MVVHVAPAIHAAEGPVRQQRIEQELHPLIDLLRVIALLRQIPAGEEAHQHVARHGDRMLALPPLRRPRAIARLLLREKPQRAIDHRLGRSIHDHGVGGGRSGVFSADG